MLVANLYVFFLPENITMGKGISRRTFTTAGAAAGILESGDTILVSC